MTDNILIGDRELGLGCAGPCGRRPLYYRGGLYGLFRLQKALLLFRCLGRGDEEAARIYARGEYSGPDRRKNRSLRPRAYTGGMWQRGRAKGDR